MKKISLAALLCSVWFFAGCETQNQELAARSEALMASIRMEAPGDYFVARRYYKKDYKMWGWVRKPGQPWNNAQLVMLNEQKMLAPDRKANNLGSDHNHEYHLKGYFSGDMVYEPASNRFYPEFVLLSYERKSTTPALIYRDARALDPAVRILEPPI